jgi:2-hydroxyacyl-CoA lyase 1
MSSATQNLAKQLRGFPREKLARLRQKVRASSNSGHALLAEALKQSGLRHIYGVPGTPVDHSFAECAARSIRPIAVATQQAAVFMAAAENYLSGRLDAAVLVSAGPAVANCATGILVARDNGWPVLVLGGRRALDREGIGYFQELDAVPLLSPIAKLAKTVRAPAEIMSEVFAACATAQTARRGPVYLDLPEDVLEGRGSSLVCGPPASAEAPQLDLAAIGESVRLLVEARRPLLIIGEDVRWTFNGSALRRLVDEFGIPFITSPMGRGFLPDDHALCGNRFRRQWQGKADLVIMAGAWFDWRFRFGTELAAGARIIHADSDRATLGKNVQARVLFLGEPGQFLSSLAEALGSELNGSSPTKYAEWQEAIKASSADSSPSAKAQCATLARLRCRRKRCIPSWRVLCLTTRSSL